LSLRVFVFLCFLAIGISQDGFVRFSNVANESGIRFRHENGVSPEKYLPETMGSGGLIFDYNNDGWPDVFLVNGGSFVNPQVAARALHRLYRNNGDGTFTDTTNMAGIGVSGYGMGACSADYDNDGWPDVYITSAGSNRLYRNTGTGRFADVTAAAGAGYKSWSSSCAFGDIDNDGDVDLYVANYLEFALDNNKYCGDPVAKVRHYCDPNVYNGVPDILYRNNGDGTFTDISRQSGISLKAGKGLGVVFTDYDGDGRIDIYVANDLVPNFLFHNKGNGVFEEAALWAGVAVGSNGRPLSGMGTDSGDINGDGLPDIVVTNMDRETHSLYRNLGDGLFADATFASGVGMATLPFVGWGVAFLDYDNDTDLDLAIANGAVLDNVGYFREGATYAQRNLLLQNDGAGKFADAGLMLGPGFALEKVSRALAVGDLDNDGDLDILIGNNGQTADLLGNDGGNRNNSLLVRTVGSKSNRSGIGARLKLTVGRSVLMRDVKAGSSYLGQNDVRVHIGLGQAARADRLEIAWPSGRVDILKNLEANQILTVLEGGDVIGRAPFKKVRDRR
jgi:hypothetical protein